MCSTVPGVCASSGCYIQRYVHPGPNFLSWGSIAPTVTATVPAKSQDVRHATSNLQGPLVPTITAEARREARSPARPTRCSPPPTAPTANTTAPGWDREKGTRDGLGVCHEFQPECVGAEKGPGRGCSSPVFCLH